tara:strand:+ start:5632 stop:5832 length:201 start_codon:yes stop_codon:yes gene_type:complete
MKNIEKQKLRKLLKNIRNKTNDSNNFDKFFGTLQRLGTNSIIEGKVSKKCRYVNRQINSKVGMTRW